jgi:hypothetical protein
MGGWGVSRARRVRCGADLLPSRLLPFSSVAIPSDAKRDLSIRMRPVCTCLRPVHERLDLCNRVQEKGAASYCPPAGHAPSTPATCGPDGGEAQGADQEKARKQRT